MNSNDNNDDAVGKPTTSGGKIGGATKGKAPYTAEQTKVEDDEEYEEWEEDMEEEEE